MRIAFVNQDAGIDPDRKKGAAVHLRAMRRAFEQVGATVLAIDHPDDDRTEAELRRHLDNGGLNLIYERYSARGYVASRIALEQDVPHVLEINAPLVEESRRFRPDAALSVDETAERCLFSNAHIVAVSEAMGTYARDRGAHADRVCVFPNAVDSELFYPRSDDQVRDRFVPPDRFVLGMHGRLREWHNFAMLVRVTERLLAEGAPVFLLVAGYGDGIDQLERLPADSYEHIPWCPHEEVASIVACFDALPMTYAPQENFYFSPLKLAEAMACGVVPIVPDLGDLPDRVEHGVTGTVYPAGDEDALTDSLQWLLADMPRTRRIQAQAAAAAKDTTWLSLARQLLDQVLVP
ncbi:MAG: glycosyltransferase involved in cell wall biosynthesis [Chlamydiales bacterium]|jgi:glycosyltransferase involved in cell wall biosynthesis